MHKVSGARVGGVVSRNIHVQEVDRDLGAGLRPEGEGAGFAISSPGRVVGGGYLFWNCSNMDFAAVRSLTTRSIRAEVLSNISGAVGEIRNGFHQDLESDLTVASIPRGVELDTDNTIAECVSPYGREVVLAT